MAKRLVYFSVLNSDPSSTESECLMTGMIKEPSAMDRHTTDDTTDVIQRLRAALEPGLPYGASLIPLDILIAVAAAHRDGAPLTVKQLIDSLPYSVTGVRYNLGQLVADGWLEKRRAEDDRRTVLLHPTEKVSAAFQQIEFAL